MARTDTLGHFLTDVADAIREKKGSVDTIAAEDFDTEIENLPSGGGSYAPEFISFHNCPDALLQDAIDDEAIDYSNVTNLSGCCSKYNGWTSTLQTIDITPITNAKNVTTLSSMFAYRNSLKTITGLDKLDTSKVTTLAQVFYYCLSIISLDLSTWDTSSVTDMSSMFGGAFTSNSTKISLDLSNFDTSNVTGFSYIFNNAKIGSLDLSGWTAKSSGGINASGMFNTSHLEHIDIRAFDFTKISSYSTMFGYNANSGLPANCEVIVADQTQKDWVLGKANWLTNVKTVAEYEAEQNQ